MRLGPREVEAKLPFVLGQVSQGTHRALLERVVQGLVLLGLWERYLELGQDLWLGRERSRVKEVLVVEEHFHSLRKLLLPHAVVTKGFVPIEFGPLERQNLLVQGHARQVLKGCLNLDDFGLRVRLQLVRLAVVGYQNEKHRVVAGPLVGTRGLLLGPEVGDGMDGRTPAGTKQQNKQGLKPLLRFARRARQLLFHSVMSVFSLLLLSASLSPRAPTA